MTIATSSFAQAPSAPPSITQATALNNKSVRNFCQSSVESAKRQAAQASTTDEIAKLLQDLDTLALIKKDYKTTAKSKSNMQGVQELRIAQAYSTILELQLVSDKLSGALHFKPVFDSVERCQKDVERLRNRNIAVDNVELTQIFEPFYKLMGPFDEAKEVLSDFDQLYDAYLKLSPAPAGATKSQVDDAEYKAGLQAIEAILSH